MFNMETRTPREVVVACDLIIEVVRPGSPGLPRLLGVVLIKRQKAPFGWALPGGHVEYGEDVWEAARREMKEETSVDADELWLMNVYGDPRRDPRKHVQSTVFVCEVGHWHGTLFGADDARDATVFGADELPEDIAFDHRRILDDYFAMKRAGHQLFFRRSWPLP
jgi:ADP-ribose pyrophosphatase YjhB (NUDIX family)